MDKINYEDLRMLALNYFFRDELFFKSHESQLDLKNKRFTKLLINSPELKKESDMFFELLNEFLDYENKEKLNVIKFFNNFNKDFEKKDILDGKSYISLNLFAKIFENKLTIDNFKEFIFALGVNKKSNIILLATHEKLLKYDGYLESVASVLSDGKIINEEIFNQFCYFVKKNKIDKQLLKDSLFKSKNFNEHFIKKADVLLKYNIDINEIFEGFKEEILKNASNKLIFLEFMNKQNARKNKKIDPKDIKRIEQKFLLDVSESSKVEFGFNVKLEFNNDNLMLKNGINSDLVRNYKSSLIDGICALIREKHAPVMQVTKSADYLYIQSTELKVIEDVNSIFKHVKENLDTVLSYKNNHKNNVFNELEFYHKINKIIESEKLKIKLNEKDEIKEITRKNKI